MEDRKEINQVEDAREVIELLKGLNDTQKAQIKGIMVGMQLTRENPTAVPA